MTAGTATSTTPTAAKPGAKAAKPASGASRAAQADARSEAQAAAHALLRRLDAAKHSWAKTTPEERVALLHAVKDAIMPVAEDWVSTASRNKQIPVGSPLEGEEWFSGPYALLSACNNFIATLEAMEGGSVAASLPRRRLHNGQTAVRIVPHTLWDRLLLSGIRAEVWMQLGIDNAEVNERAAQTYAKPADARKGRVALVLGAGNIAAIPLLDTLQKLLVEDQVVLLKLNPVNDYLLPFFEAAFKPLIDRDFLAVIPGDAALGAWACEHDLVEEIHVTGAGSTHDAIVWGKGADGERRRQAGTPLNSRRITSELGAVCPTIVVPGPWNAGDVRYQAEQIATQKLHNGGHNCVSCQTLIMPEGWDQAQDLLDGFRTVVASGGERGVYYPGAKDRLRAFADRAASGGGVERLRRGATQELLLTTFESDADGQHEVFAPAMNIKWLEGSDPAAFLEAAIDFANDRLEGTLGANIVIHPATRRAIGEARFEELIGKLAYGEIAINAWTGVNFLAVALPWGGFPGTTPENVGSGIGVVHNTFMLEGAERSVLEAPWRPFPRGLLGGSFALMPKPPWFVTHRRAAAIGRQMTHFAHRPSLLKIPGIFLNVLRD